MRRCLPRQRTHWRAVVRVLLNVLAFVGMQAAFARAAFPHREVPAGRSVLQQAATDHPMPSVDAARVPQRVNRRASSPLGPYVPSPAPAPEVAVAGAGAAPPASHTAPPRFVPSPPFHPPRALGA